MTIVSYFAFFLVGAIESGAKTWGAYRDNLVLRFRRRRFTPFRAFSTLVKYFQNYTLHRQCFIPANSTGIAQRISLYNSIIYKHNSIGAIGTEFALKTSWK